MKLKTVGAICVIIGTALLTIGVGATPASAVPTTEPPVEQTVSPTYPATPVCDSTSNWGDSDSTCGEQVYPPTSPVVSTEAPPITTVTPKSPHPTPATMLPETGAKNIWLLLVGVLLLTGGSVFFYAARRS